MEGFIHRFKAFFDVIGCDDVGGQLITKRIDENIGITHRNSLAFC
jgi:hypothetical protein